MLILTNKKGVAAFVFTTEIRGWCQISAIAFLPTNGREESGEGRVFEKYTRHLGDKPGKMRVVAMLGDNSFSKPGAR